MYGKAQTDEQRFLHALAIGSRLMSGRYVAAAPSTAAFLYCAGLKQGAELGKSPFPMKCLPQDFSKLETNDNKIDGKEPCTCVHAATHTLLSVRGWELETEQFSREMCWVKPSFHWWSVWLIAYQPGIKERLRRASSDVSAARGVQTCISSGQLQHRYKENIHLLQCNSVFFTPRYCPNSSSLE